MLIFLNSIPSFKAQAEDTLRQPLTSGSRPVVKPNRPGKLLSCALLFQLQGCV